ncbi:PAS domain S-box protein [Pseudothauera nasutitermitis]|uniref:PAS domain S-box protein n=1 Tax=Pseudothauera nasutitermitis TaxID=2565930 RepID=A0A4S4B2R8_9RHOO|nr:PAS domain-containing sensor histidine kinase [Pseudothauera nasutitermitis]THF66485.1 PAS domain S-box protein [Pseudothauera nasutitermitis]
MFADLHHLSHHAAWRRQLEMLLESTGEGIYGIDLRGRCIFINGAGAEILGYTPDEVLGRNMHYLIHHSHPDAALMPVHDCRIFKAFKEGRGVRVEDEVLWRRDGSSFPAEYASYPIRDGEAVVGAVVTFNDITERKRTEAALRAAHEQLERRVAERTAELSAANTRLSQAGDALRRLSEHLNRVREEERAHIARDIHDDLGASLTAMQLELNWLRRRLGTDEKVRTHIDTALEIGQGAMGAVRRILNDLRPGVLDHLGLWAALEYLLQDTETRTGLRCSLRVAPEAERCRLGHEAETALYRIAQEVLTNVQRHAAAGRVDVDVRAEGRALVLEMADDGCGMRVPAEPTSFGLLGMHERARALGGQLAMDSGPGRGTRVTLNLPEVLA